VTTKTDALLRHLASRPGHDEVKADFRELLVGEFGVELGALEFERRVPEVRGRLDALIGRTVFEAKSDLAREWPDVARKMPDYLADREREEGEKFVGLASDGLRWAAFELSGGALEKIKETQLDPERSEEFLAWLDGVVALKGSLPPDPLTIRAELGRDSLAFRRADAELAELWTRLKADPAVYLKRQLWAELLKLVYGREIENEELWRQHTFLVIVAKCVALAVMGLREDDPKRLLAGDAFVAAGINGAVESDFFDWVVADKSGEALLRRIMTHVRRFRLAEVHSDILKILYESLIDRDERHGLGEYYTPDWLAAKVVKAAVSAPLEQRVLDPACGSGTFLFHAIRLFLAEAEEAGLDEKRRAFEISQHIAGMDIHPVATIIARVTYLLALAPALAQRAGPIYVPVYLGDAMQLSISQLLAGKELTIRVPPPRAGDGQSGEKDANGREQLDFPDTFCRDPALFDKAIERMRTGSEQGMAREQIEKALYRITEQHYRADVTDEQQLAIRDLGKTYVTFDRLRREGRDSVWAYVARNLSRPLAYSAAGGWAHVVVGNPPWVAYRHMSQDLQKRFKELAKGARVHVGGKFATQSDLCALFTVRAASLYLRSGGRIGFVLPMAVLSRGQFEPLRRGSFDPACIQWDDAWAMNDDVQPLFPVPSCVLLGRRRATSRAAPEQVRVYSGALPMRDAPEALVDLLIEQGKFTVVEKAPRPVEGVFTGGSAYRNSFRQGATLVPRMLCFVERKQMGRLGHDLSAPAVVSRRSNQEKKPWKELPGIEGKVEIDFLRPVLLGESILPYRIWAPLEAVIPVDEKGVVLDAEAALNRGFDGLNGWMRKAEQLWADNAENDKMTLVGRWNYHNELGAQFPVPKLRVVYAKAGTLLAATVVRDSSFVIDHMLYWSAPASEGEARYLAAILNSETTRARAAHWQARGQWGARHFDKVIFNLPIPRYDAKNKTHAALANAAAKAEKIAAAVALPEGVKFQRARKLVREALTEAGVAQDIDALVGKLLDS
jgi:SAM-dependent methyltransferase